MSDLEVFVAKKYKSRGMHTYERRHLSWKRDNCPRSHHKKATGLASTWQLCETIKRLIRKKSDPHIRTRSFHPSVVYLLYYRSLELEGSAMEKSKRKYNNLSKIHISMKMGVRLYLPQTLGMTTTGVDTVKNAQLDRITTCCPLTRHPGAAS